MEAYTDFAGVYDTFMDETPYEEWADYLIALIEQYGISKPCGSAGSLCGEEAAADEAARLASERNLIVDLGCGTGSLTELLAAAGYDMIGIDSSPEMLQIAGQKAERTADRAALMPAESAEVQARTDKPAGSVLYLLQDMRELELYSTAGTFVSVCDSLNYLLSEEDLLTTFRLVNNYLYPGGIFIFDFNTVYKYEEVIGDTTIAENREKCSFIWDNYYHPEEQINEYDLTIFVQEEHTEYYRKFTETHYQERLYIRTDEAPRRAVRTCLYRGGRCGYAW